MEKENNKLRWKPQEPLKKLEEKIKNTEVGVELWFDREEYEEEVVSGEKTFEEWFEEILSRAF
jgi:hypothetical protein